MSKTFHTYIKKYQFHPFELLFDDSVREYIKNEYTEKTSTLYAIVETDKTSFLPQTFTFDEKFCANGKIKVSDTEHDISLNISKSLYDSDSELSQNLRKNFQTIDDFNNYCMQQYNNDEEKNLSSGELYKNLVKIDKKASSDKTLYSSCPLWNVLTNSTEHLAEYNIYQMINFFDYKVLNDLEILYIGKSTSSTFERLRKHEKWGPIMANKNPNKDYFVYFFEIDESSLTHNQHENTSVLIKDNNNIKMDSIVKLCESSLINYYKPKYNKEHVDTILEETGYVKKALTSNGYTEMITEVYLEGPFGKISTPSRKFQEYTKIKNSL